MARSARLAALLAAVATLGGLAAVGIGTTSAAPDPVTTRATPAPVTTGERPHDAPGPEPVASQVARERARRPATSTTRPARASTTVTVPVATAPAATAAPTTVPPATLPPTTAPPAAPALPVPDTVPPDPYADVPTPVLGAIVIPAIGLRHTIYEGVTLTAIDQGPGHWPGTAMPGGYGNAVFGGHRTTHSAPFLDIDRLAPGDEIIFEMADGTRPVYRVTEQFVVDPSALWIVDQTPGSTVTLFACHPKGSAAQRIVVRGVLVA